MSTPTTIFLLLIFIALGFFMLKSGWPRTGNQSFILIAAIVGFLVLYGHGFFSRVSP